ncbi:hypothetical protein QL285_060480 [Trifolium repens]|nr:hypothetical protein QL285_060480 [Trifolium repens]
MEESQRILDEKLQASRLALQEKLQQISDKYTKLKKSRNNIVVEKNSEKVEEKQEDTEFITLVEEQPKKLVDDSDFLPITDPNLQIFDEVNKEEKVKESKTHHDSLSTSLCPKPPPTTRFLSTLPPPATPLKPPDPPPKPPDLLIIHSTDSPPSSPPKPREPPPKPPFKITIAHIILPASGTTAISETTIAVL